MDKPESEGGKASKPATGREVYNLVTDTVVGPNVRLRDNVYQGLVILAGLVIGAGIGYWKQPEDPKQGAMIGGFIGLVAGLFVSGIFLMIFRGIRHTRGRHD